VSVLTHTSMSRDKSVCKTTAYGLGYNVTAGVSLWPALGPQSPSHRMDTRGPSLGVKASER